MGENECTIAIYLYGDDIRLGDASVLLGLTPTRSGNRGDQRTASSGTQSARKIGFWEYREVVSINELDLSLSRLLRAITAKDAVVGLAGITRAELDIFKPIEPDDNPFGLSFDLSPCVLQRLAQLGLNLIVTAR